MFLKLSTFTVLCSLVLMPSVAAAQDTAASERGESAPVTTPADTQTPEMTALDVIDRYIEVTGGRSNWAALTSIRGIGRIQMSALPIEGRFNVEQTCNGYRMSVDMFQLTDQAETHVAHQVTVRNGDQTWRIQKDGPAQPLPAVAHADLVRKQSFNPLLDAKTRYSSITLQGTELVEDAPCWKIGLNPVDQSAPLEVRWFDVAEGLQRKFAETPRGGGLTAEVFLSDYRQVGTVKLHYKMRIVSVGASVERSFDAMQTNVTIDDCLFEAPATP